MIRGPNLTSAGLLDHVEALLLRNGRWREGSVVHAHLVDADGLVTRVRVPVLHDDDYATLGAILGMEMRDRAAVAAVLQLPTDGGEDTTETVTLLALGAAGEELERRILRFARGRNNRIGRRAVGDGERDGFGVPK